jgi:protein SDA1
MGDKGKLRSNPNASAEGLSNSGDEAMWAVVLTKELWRKGVWCVSSASRLVVVIDRKYRNDAKSVAIVALGCFHPVTKVQSASLHFFLGSDEECEDSDDSDDDVCPWLAFFLSPHFTSIRPLMSNHSSTNAKSRKKPATATGRCVRCSRRRAKFGRFHLSYDLSNAWFQKRKSKDSRITTKFPALQLLHDPQTFGEKLYDLLQKYDARFSLDHKILIMQLLARVTALHQLSILGFYTYMLKYLTHHQLRAPAILAGARRVRPCPDTTGCPDTCNPQIISRICSPRRWARGGGCRSERD